MVELVVLAGSGVIAVTYAVITLALVIPAIRAGQTPASPPATAAYPPDSGERRRLRDLTMPQRIAASRGVAAAERNVYAAMLRAIIANKLSLVYVKDLRGRYLLANETFEQSFSVREADLLAQPDDSLDPVLPPEWRANDVRAQQGQLRVEEFAEVTDGRHIYESVRFPLHDPDGELYATAAISLDVTEVRRAVCAAERARAEAMRVAEQALDEALAQSQVKSQFMATMSHEIRTPMNGVIGLASLLMGTELDVAQRRYAAGVHTAGNALLGVINDILDFSKNEAGKLVLDTDDFDLRAVVNEVAALVTPTALGGVSVAIRTGEKLPSVVRGDSGRLRQILLNLAGNAVKFTTVGSVTVSVDLAAGRPGDPDTVVVRFEVTDTGVGIARADAERLFEPFTQADASTTRTYGGTGLGLAICRQLTEAMGGTIGVDSEPGQGSTFWCLIPFGPVGQPNARARSTTAPDISGLRVLVVDASASQAMLQASLRQWEMTATAADNAADALQMLRQAADRGRPFDVAIIDAELADIDAVDLAGQITADSRIPTVHIIVLNDDGGPTDPDGAATGSVYLAKPVHQSHLYECLTRAMTSAPGRAAAPPRSDLAPMPRSRPPGARRVLLVEDNDINQMVAVGILTGLGYESDVATDGLEAVRLAATRSYDAVLMDCRMPRMDGFSATAEIRRQESGSRDHTPIIAMTASALVADRVRCLAAGMDDYITKPVSPATLASALDRWTTGTVPLQDGGGPGPAAEPDGDPITRRLDELRGDGGAAEQALLDRHRGQRVPADVVVVEV